MTPEQLEMATSMRPSGIHSPYSDNEVAQVPDGKRSVLAGRPMENTITRMHHKGMVDTSVRATWASTRGQVRTEAHNRSPGASPHCCVLPGGRDIKLQISLRF
jgi:hypothetical protein